MFGKKDRLKNEDLLVVNVSSSSPKRKRNLLSQASSFRKRYNSRVPKNYLPKPRPIKEQRDLAAKPKECKFLLDLQPDEFIRMPDVPAFEVDRQSVMQR